jgi:endonuclease/exonuclease/phosphatase family metal-dependent hydrolase
MMGGNFFENNKKTSMTKRIILVVYICLSFMMMHAQSLHIATYNLRYDNAEDSLDRWKTRFPVIAGLVQLYDFDIFGTQEGLSHQLEDLKGALPGYDYIGVGRDDGAKAGEHSAIFYKTGKFTLLDKGNFWLSSVTDRPNKGWDAVCIRICSWGKFKEKATGFVFYQFNVHFDHKGEQAKRESAKLVLEMMKKIAGKSPAFLTGDFNLDEKHETYPLMANSGYVKDAFELAQFRLAPNGTFNGFNVNAKPEGRIDHIFLTKEFKVTSYGILTNTYNGHFPSDHFPVLATVAY